MHPEEQVGMSAEAFAEIHERITNGEYPQPMVVLRDAQALADEVERLRECLATSGKAWRELNGAYIGQVERNNALLAQFETTGAVSEAALPSLPSLPPGLPPLPNLWPARPDLLGSPPDDMQISAFVTGMDAPPLAGADGTLEFDLRELDAPGQDFGRPPSRPGARVTVAIPAKGDAATTCAQWLARRFRSPVLVTFSDPGPPEAAGSGEETPE